MYSFTSCTVNDCNTTALSGSDFCVLHLSDAANHIKAVYETIRQQKTIKNINLAGVPLDGWILKQRQFFGCSFAGAQLNNIDWSDSVFRMCFFDFCTIKNAQFCRIDAQFCSFAGAAISDTTFIGSELVHNNFNGVHTVRCNFSNSSLYNTRFIKSQLAETDFIDCDLKKTFFLDISQTSVNWKFSNTQEAYFELTGADF